jgi:hypothetical protein
MDFTGITDSIESVHHGIKPSPWMLDGTKNKV